MRSYIPTPKSLAGELERWKRLWSNIDDPQTIPSNLVQALGSCDAESYRNIYQLLLIGCTLPITSTEAERTFSLLRRIKTYTRSTLTEEHFSDLALMAMHYQQRIPVQEILEAFCQLHPRRIFQKSLLEDYIVLPISSSNNYLFFNIKLNGVASVPVPGLNILLLEYRYQ